MFALLSKLFLLASWDTEALSSISRPLFPPIPFSPLHLLSLPAGYLGNPGTLASFPLSFKHPSSHTFSFHSHPLVVVTLVSVPRLSCDLICHRRSPAASPGWLVGLGFVDSGIFLSQWGTSQKPQHCNFLLTSQWWRQIWSLWGRDGVFTCPVECCLHNGEEIRRWKGRGSIST